VYPQEYQNSATVKCVWRIIPVGIGIGIGKPTHDVTANSDCVDGSGEARTHVNFTHSFARFWKSFRRAPLCSLWYCILRLNVNPRCCWKLREQVRMFTWCRLVCEVLALVTVAYLFPNTGDWFCLVRFFRKGDHSVLSIAYGQIKCNAMNFSN